MVVYRKNFHFQEQPWNFEFFMPILFLTFHFHEKKNDSTFRIVIVNLLTMKIKLTEILEFNNSNVRQDDGEKSGGLQVRGHLQEHTD